MQQWKRAGTWLAMGVVVAGAGWGFRQYDQWKAGRSGAIAETAGLAASSSSPLLQVPVGANVDTPVVIQLDAAVVRRALRDGELRIALPDGTTYPVKMERQDTDATGHWNVVGRVQTARGPQAMVLTFGADAVFGVVPMPDGHLKQITTGPGGEISIAPAGGTVPASQAHADLPAPDFIAAPRAATGPKSQVADRPDTGARHLVADQPLHVTATPSSPVANKVAARAAPGTSLVTINVLAFYAPDLVTLRGTVDAAKTEIAHLFAVANQAHIDSGSRVRVNAVAMLPLDASLTADNSEMLEQMSSPYQPFGIETLRDTYEADLVTLVRPYHDGDASCGIAYLAGADLQRNHQLEAGYAYSVVDVAPCGPFVLAHELGHLLGSTHDRKTVQDGNGFLRYGAYAYSFGNRTPTFATVMAYELGQPEVGYFSNPLNTGCGDWCGVDKRSDNVQSIARMAEAVAAFRGPKGTASVAPTERLEPVGGINGVLYVPIRLSMPAPADALTFTVQAVGGTATEGVDYTFDYGRTATVYSGGRTAWLPIQLIGDDLVEGDETIIVRVTPPAGTTMAVDTAMMTIADDDPRMLVQGKLVFPPGAAPPTQAVDIDLLDIDGEVSGNPRWTAAAPPNFEFPLQVAAGSPMRVFARLPAPYFADIVQLNEVSEDRVLEMPVVRGVLIGGRARLPPGATTEFRLNLQFYESKDNISRPADTVLLWPPDFTWARYVAPGSNIRYSIEPTTLYGTNPNINRYEAILWNVRTDMAFDMALSDRPTIYPWGGGTYGEGTQGALVIQLSAPAPAGGVSVHYAAIDGTAKAGEDFAPISGTVLIPQGETRALVDFNIVQDQKFEPQEYFTFAIDSAVGATISLASMRVRIATSRRPSVQQVPIRR